MAFTPGTIEIEIVVNDVPFRLIARGRFVTMWWKPGGGGEDCEWQYCITVGNDDEGWTILNRMAGFDMRMMMEACS